MFKINFTRKITNIHKDFEVYQVFMHDFLYQDVPIFHYIYSLMGGPAHFSQRVSILKFPDIPIIRIAYKKS